MVTESIFDNGNVVIPMADVQHIQHTKYAGNPNGIFVITKHTKYNREVDDWENPIWISEEEKPDFMSAWCYYRHELESITATPSNKPI